MATHRLRRDRRLAPFNAKGLTRTYFWTAMGCEVLALAVFLLFFADWRLALAWSVFSLLSVLVTTRAIAKAHRRMELDLVKDQEMLDYLATQPGGAPLVADVEAHCGCTLRYAWHDPDSVWKPVSVLTSSDSCLIEAR